MSEIATEEEVTANAKIELEAQLFLAEVFEDRRKNPKEDLNNPYKNFIKKMKNIQF